MILLVLGGNCDQLEVGLSGLTGAGFFMRPFYPTFNDTSLQEWPLLAFSGLQYVTATYGPFAAQSDTSNIEKYSTVGNQTTQIIDNYVVSAHLVSDNVDVLKPYVSVLFHSGNGNPRRRSKNPSSSDSGSRERRKLCLTAYVENSDEELMSSCVVDPSSDSDVCVANFTLPYRWWYADDSRSVNVYYSAMTVRNSRKCPGQSGGISVAAAARNEKIFASPVRDVDKLFVSRFNLVMNNVKYDEIREDQNVLIYVPIANFSLGSVFHVPIKLRPDSSLQTFSMRLISALCYYFYHSHRLLLYL